MASQNPTETNPTMQICSCTGVYERVSADGQLNSNTCECSQLYIFHEDRPYPANVLGPILYCNFRDLHEEEDVRGLPRWVNCDCFLRVMNDLVESNSSWLPPYGPKSLKIWQQKSEHDTCDADLTVTRQLAYRDEVAQSYYPHADRAHEKAEAPETESEEDEAPGPFYEEAWAGNPSHEAAWEMLSRAGYDAFQFALLVQMMQAAGVNNYRSLYTAFRLMGEVRTLFLVRAIAYANSVVPVERHCSLSIPSDLWAPVQVLGRLRSLRAHHGSSR